MPKTPTVELDGQKLRDMRTAAGYGTGTFAKRIAPCNRDYLCQIESNRVQRISKVLYSRIIRVLGVEWDALLRDSAGNSGQVAS